MMKRFTQPVAIFLFSLIISIPLILPYFHSGYFPTHDGEWAVVRLGDMFRTIKDHQFPARYSGTLNMEYGYPLFNFAYPFPYYAGIFLYALRFGFVGSLKILFAMTVPLSVFFMFLLSQKLWKNVLAGAVSAILFAYLPYRIVDLYARGSIGESISFILFPLLFYVVVKIAEQKNNYFIILGSISYAILITSHNIMAVYATPLLILFMWFYAFMQKSLIKPYLILLLGGIMLSAFFWLPALLEKHDILLSQIPIADRNLYFVNPMQLVIPKWGYGLPTQKDGFSYQLGLAQILLFLGSVIFLIIGFAKKQHKKSPELRVLFFLSVIVVFMTMLLFSWTAFIWQLTPLVKEINYPWTLLLPLGFFMSLIAGYLATKKMPIILLVGVAVICAVIFVLPHAKPQYYSSKGDQYYLTNEATTTSSHEYMPLWVKKIPLERPAEKVSVLGGKGKIDTLSVKSNAISFTPTLAKAGTVRINTIYYPGWKITLDNIAVQPNYQNAYGVMDIQVPSGSHTVRAFFTETPSRLFADLLSLIGLIFVLLLFYRPFAKKLLQ